MQAITFFHSYYYRYVVAQASPRLHYLLKNCRWSFTQVSTRVFHVVSIELKRLLSPLVQSWSYQVLKGTISDRPFPTSLFSETPDFFLQIQKKLHCSNLHFQQFSQKKQHMFGKRDNSLLLRIDFHWRN